MKKLFAIILLAAMTTAANAQVKGDMNDDGELNIVDVTIMVNIILGNAQNPQEPQCHLDCPDENHPHIIDLGLPSGTKWSCCNVGADTPEGYGGYYAWGETQEKEVYNEVTYQYNAGDDTDGDGWYDDWHSETEVCGIWLNLGNYMGENTDRESVYDIAGTNYDVAHVKWGGAWVMPSLDQIQELVNNCTKTWTEKNGVKGRCFTGPNGGSIFLPAAGYRTNDELNDADSYGNYWTSTQYPAGAYGAYKLHFWSNKVSWNNSGRCLGITVRPIYR